VDAAILRCLEKEPVRRPSSAVELLAALPGGDPLAAALQAGETPSPEMVAAAGEEGSLSSAKAWGLFGLTLAAVAATIVFSAKISGLDQVPMTRSPDVLRERAHEIAQMLGDDVPPRSSTWWVNLDPGYVEFSREHPTTAPSLVAARPSALRFYYRQSPRHIGPTGSVLVTRSDPPPAWTGEAYVALDQQGRLLEFARLAPQVAPDSGSSPLDWNKLLALTSVDVTTLREAAPLWTPDVACDTRRAWLGSDEGQPVRYEAAAWRGKPVWLRTVATWERPDRDASMPAGPPLGFVFVGVVLATSLAFVPLARHNLRLGRSDRLGATRVGVAVFLCFALAQSLRFHWALDANLIWRWVQRLPYFPGLAAWLYYLGIEPFFRRRWPHRLIAWARLLEGRFADPIVGRQLLTGILIGTGVALAGGLQVALERRPDLGVFETTLPLGGAAEFLSSTADGAGSALIQSLGLFAVLLLLRVLLRRDFAAWLGLGALWAILRLPSGNVSAIGLVGIAAGTALLLLAMRMGLLVTVSAWMTNFLFVFVTPLTLDFSRWYAWRTVAIAALLLAIAAWSFRAAMGRHKILTAAMFEG
ncbi:MAG TPA: hypothetical protein VER77_06925, partial [Candidatus Dormibacteraeota bacterium]|nr:hypothetical protein [Candidatus Dormibacteraeota bacterium]